MDTFSVTLETVLSIVGIGLLGFWILLRKLLPDDVIKILAPLAIDVALPCLIFSNIMKSFNPQHNQYWYQFPLFWVIFTMGTFVATLAFSFLIKEQYRSEFRVGLFYHNGIFIPLGIIQGVWGIDSVYITDLFLFTLFYPAFFFNTYHFFFRKSNQQWHYSFDWKIVQNPILVATIASVILKISGLWILIPKFVVKITSLISCMALPLIMLIIGGSIYLDFQKRSKLYVYEVITFVIGKNILFPGIVLFVLEFFKPPFDVALIVLLASAVPPITAFPIVTEKAGGNRNIANQMMTASFIISVVTIPAAMWILQYIYGK